MSKFKVQLTPFLKLYLFHSNKSKSNTHSTESDKTDPPNMNIFLCESKSYNIFKVGCVAAVAGSRTIATVTLASNQY